MKPLFEKQEKTPDRLRFYPWFLAVAAVVAVAGLIYAWMGVRQAGNKTADVTHRDLQKAAKTGDLKTIHQDLLQLKKIHANTFYAWAGALLAAKVYFNEKNFDGAIDTLRWLIRPAVHETVQYIARLRLAASLAETKHYQDALNWLKTDRKSAEYADLEGDIFVSMGQISAAQAAYRTSLKAMQPNQPLYSLVQLKLNAL